MRKKLILATIIFTMLTGCNSVKAETSSTEQTTQIETTTQEETTTIAETETETEIRENTSFRNTNWGDDIETVKKYENSSLVSESNDSLLYEGSVLNNDTYIIYFFKDNKLYKGIYGIKSEYSNAGQYIPQYNRLRDGLKEIYGEPIEDLIIPMADQSQIDYSGEANSLKFGYVTYRAVWKTETSDIMIGMQAENYEIKIVIMYQDINYKEDVSKSGL